MLVLPTSNVFLRESNKFWLVRYLDLLAPLEMAYLILTKFFLYELVEILFESPWTIMLSSASKTSLDTLSLTDYIFIYWLALNKLSSYIIFGEGWSNVTFWYKLTLYPSFCFILSNLTRENLIGEECLFEMNLFLEFGFFFLLIKRPDASNYWLELCSIV